MTSVTADHVKPLRDAQDPAAHRAFVPLLILFVMSLGLILTWARIVAVWQTGSIHDPDDAMRLEQVRALLAGQNWFDMTVYRLDPPGGVFMHWSRVVDIPLAILIKAFGLVLPAEEAERLTRIVFPLLLQVALYAAVARLAKSLLGRDAIMPAIFMVLLSGIAFGQFQPGRIDHHAPQIVLLAFMLGGLVEGVKARHMLPAAVAGGLAALSLAISLENIPFIFMFWGLAGGLWLWQGRAMRLVMAGFALGLLIALPFCFLATVGPAHWFLSVPDAFSFGQLIAGMAGASVCLVLAFLPGRLDRLPVRLMLALAGAVVTLGLVALFGSGALREPFADLDPLVRDVWLSNVHEAWSFLRLSRQEPETASIFMLPSVLGLVASIVAACIEKGRLRLQWLLVSATVLTGVLMSFWLVRVLSSVGPIAPLGGLWAVMTFNAWLARSGRRKAALWSFVLLLPFVSIPWALAIGGNGTNVKKVSENCLETAAFEPFAALPPGLILAPIDSGSHLLAFTSHSVLAAPYHRNNHGNVVALKAFLAPPDESRAIVMASGANYVAICVDLDEAKVLGERRPQSLSAALSAGDVPDWLVSVSVPHTPYRIFTVRP